MPNWEELYLEKNAYLGTYCEEVTPREFYRDLWPEGTFEREGHPEDQKPNGLALQIRGKGRAYHRIITDGLEQLEDLLEHEFVITSPVSYFGQRRSGENARYVYALTFDLDGVEMQQLRDLLHQMNNDLLPKATYIVNSGHGLHLYYFLKHTHTMMPHIQACLKELKYALTRQIWNRYTSTRKDVEVQGILQGFRMVGSQSKLGKEYPVVAFRYGDRVDLDYLMSFVPELSGEREKIFAALDSKVTLEEAARLWPEWHQRRILEGKPRGKWPIKRALYDYWLRRLRNEVKVGHRFYAIMTLAIYGAKCSVYHPKKNPNPVTEEELRRDAYSLLDAYDAMSESEDNRFTEDDIETALTAFLDTYCTFPRDDIAKYSGLQMTANKRNWQKQADHLEEARAIRDIRMKRRGLRWDANNGRPSKEQQVRELRAAYPEASVSELSRISGISRPTLYKYLKTTPSEGVGANES